MPFSLSSGYAFGKVTAAHQSYGIIPWHGKVTMGPSILLINAYFYVINAYITIMSCHSAFSLIWIRLQKRASQDAVRKGTATPWITWINSMTLQGGRGTIKNMKLHWWPFNPIQYNYFKWPMHIWYIQIPSCHAVFSLVWLFLQKGDRGPSIIWNSSMT